MSDPTYLYGTLRIAAGAPTEALLTLLGEPDGPLDLNSLDEALTDRLSISKDLGGPMEIVHDPAQGLTITFRNTPTYEDGWLADLADVAIGRVRTDFEGDESLLILLADGSYREIPSVITYPGAEQHDAVLRAAGIEF